MDVQRIGNFQYPNKAMQLYAAAVKPFLEMLYAIADIDVCLISYGEGVKQESDLLTLIEGVKMLRKGVYSLNLAVVSLGKTIGTVN